MHRTSTASTRNSLGFVKHFDTGSCSHVNHSIDHTSTDALNSTIPDDDASFLNSNRIQHESSLLLVDDILYSLSSSSSSSPSESQLCSTVTEWKPSPRRKSNPRCVDGHSSQDHLINVTEAEDFTETTATVRSISDVIDDVVEANQLHFALDEIGRRDTKSFNHDECCCDSNTNQSVEGSSFITSFQEDRQFKTDATLQMATIEQITSDLRSIILLNVQSGIIHPSRRTSQMVQDCNTSNLSRYNVDVNSGLTSADENNGIKLNKKAMSLDHTYHESRHLSNMEDIDESSNSDGCWTEEECGTATSSDFLVLPVIYDNNSNEHYSNRSNSRYYHPLRQSMKDNNDGDDNDDDHHQYCAGSISSSSSGCSINLSIHSCQSSVTWYEGSNIDEIDISSKNSNYDDDDALSSSSYDPEMYSTFT